MQRAQQSGQNPQEFIQHMIEHNHIPEMVSEVVRGKALASIVESATVTDASGNHVELKNLQPDGTIAEPDARTSQRRDRRRRPATATGDAGGRGRHRQSRATERRRRLNARRAGALWANTAGLPVEVPVRRG